MKKSQEMKNEQGEQEPMTLSTTYMNSVVRIQQGRPGAQKHSFWLVFIMSGFYYGVYY